MGKENAERQTPNGKAECQNRKSQIANRKFEGDWFYRAGRRGQDDADRRAGLAVSAIAIPKSRIAILSHDPSVVGEGALLGDRATMINSQDDRVFMRSMATRGQAGGLSPATEDCLALLASVGLRLRHYRDGRHRPGSDAVSEAWNCRSNRAGDESRLRQPVAVAENRDARSGRHCGREQERSTSARARRMRKSSNGSNKTGLPAVAWRRRRISNWSTRSRNGIATLAWTIVRFNFEQSCSGVCVNAERKG